MGQPSKIKTTPKWFLKLEKKGLRALSRSQMSCFRLLGLVTFDVFYQLWKLTDDNLFCQLLVRLSSSGTLENQTVCKQVQECGIPTLGMHISMNECCWLIDLKSRSLELAGVSYSVVVFVSPIHDDP